MKLFEEAHDVAELGPGEASCEVCGCAVSSVALVGIFPQRWTGRTVFVEGLGDVELEPLVLAPSKVCICVGPCGHSSLDAGPDEFVYRWTRQEAI